MANFFASYPVSANVAAGSNPSVGPNGTPIPADSTLVGGENPGGNLQPLQTDNAGNLLVSIAAEPGAPIAVNVTEYGGVATTLGQKLSTASQPVVIASDQSAVTVAQATAANLNATVVQGTAANLQAQVSQPTASALNATVVQGTASNLLSQVSQPTASALNATVVQATASNLNAAVVGVGTAGTPSGGVLSVQGVSGGQSLPVTGTVTVTSTTANQGTPNTLANAWPQKITDGTNGPAAVKAASTAAVATDPALVVAISPNNSVAITQAQPGSLFSGQKTSTGTAVAISTSQALTTGVIVQALSTNVQSVYVGPSGISSSTGFELQPGQATSMAVNNLDLVFVIATNSGDGVCYVGS